MSPLGRRTAWVVALVSLLGLVAVGAAGGSPRDWERLAARLTPPKVVALVPPHAFPLHVSKNGRYLVDRRGAPFMIVGDSPQSLIANLSLKDAAAYIADRKAAGFDALWVNLLCKRYTGCRSDGTTYDGIAPFTREDDLSTPNPAYYDRAAAIVRLAQQAGIAVFLDPIETGGWLDVLRSNGAARDAAYGRFVGRRFRSFHNIVWLSGNDFQSWRNRRDDAVVRAVALGIRSADPTALQTVELDYLKSASRDDPRWRTILKLDAAYTYFATYAEVLHEYERRPAVPVFLVEAGYEFEQDKSSISYGSPQTLRRQEYWTALSGATGQFYGNHYTWPFADGWTSTLDTEGSAQLGYLVDLLAHRHWYQLVPDVTHRLVTRGYGTFSPDSNVASSDYITTAATPNKRLAISYLPRGGTIRVALSRMRRRVRASWYDPTSGKYTGVKGSPFFRRTSVSLTSPPRNHAGERDWVLVLAAA
jgi:hypothetical protein